MWKRDFISRVVQAHPDWLLSAIETLGDEACESIEAILRPRAEKEAVNVALSAALGVDLSADKETETKIAEMLTTAKTRAAAIKQAAVDADAEKAKAEDEVK